MRHFTAALIADREDRAVEVAQSYLGNALAPGVYQVTHPQDAGRSYTVDMNTGECSCPDFTCRRKTAPNWKCKHSLAVLLLERKTKREPTEREKDADTNRRFREALKAASEDPYRTD